MNGLAIIAVVAAIIGLVVAVGLASWISKADEGNDRMKEIAGFIREGAMAFLAREYKVMVIVIAVLFLLIGFFISWITGILAIIFGIIQLVKGNKKGMAIVGLITGGIGFAASIILYILIFFTGLGSYSSYNDIYDHIYDDIYDDIEDSMDDGTI